MLVDLSHVSPDTMADAIRVVAGAGDLFALGRARAERSPAQRARQHPAAAAEERRRDHGDVRARLRDRQRSMPGTSCRPPNRIACKAAAPNDAAAVKAGVDKWTAANPAPRATISDVADHVDHIRKVAGIDHIGIGSDFDGISQTVQDLDNVSTYPALTAELLKRGYTDADIRKILGQNMLRVMREAEKVVEAAAGRARPFGRRFSRRRAASAPAAASAPEPIEITLERTVCFGTCPAYTVTLRDDGTVTYEGRQHVKVSGKQTWKIDPAAVRALAQEMQDAGFFELQDEYTSHDDRPPDHLHVADDRRRSKKVKDYVAGPPKLKDIEAKIDEVAGTKKYVEADDQAGGGDRGTVTPRRARAARRRRQREGGRRGRVTLVMRAAETGNAEIVRLLLAAGADPDRARSPRAQRRRSRARRARHRQAAAVRADPQAAHGRMSALPALLPCPAFGHDTTGAFASLRWGTPPRPARRRSSRRARRRRKAAGTRRASTPTG